MRDPKYPSVVSISVDEGLAPKEMRLLKKVSGESFDKLDPETQLQATGFIALMRLFPQDDPGTLWEAADETRVKPPEGAVVNPLSDGD